MTSALPKVGPVAGPVLVSVRAADGASADDLEWVRVSMERLGAASPWRTFRWHKGQKHLPGFYWSATISDQAATGELARSLPVREFRWYKGQRHYSGWYRSATMKGLVAYESRLELARIMIADFDPGVTAIAGQPFRLIGSDGDRIRRHVPDILLVMSDGSVTVVDVKSPHKRDDPDVRAVMEWTRRTGRATAGKGGNA